MTHPALDTALRVGLVRRLLCIVYDLLLIIALIFIASIPPVVLFSAPAAGGGELQPAFYQGHPLWLAAFYLYLATVVFGFYGWFWTHGGQSLGMKTWGVRVEQWDGRPLTWGVALKRYVWAIVSWAIAGIGFLMSLFRADGMALHDLKSGTRLVKTRRPRQPDAPPEA